MALKARIFEALLYRIAVVLLVCVLSGCGSQSGQLQTYMRPELLYLSHQPYSRLYVEVDTIEGIEVPDRLLDDLKAFLGKYCSKPDGIEIVRDEPVPIPEVEALPISLASISCIDGPRPDSGPQPAYLHLFFYDTDMVFKRIRRNPNVPGFCPCAIFFNVDYARRWSTYLIKHEAGHVLGLCKNAVHGDGTHCRNHDCLMCAMPDLFSQLASLVASPPGGQICADCRHDLELWKSEDAGSNLIFKGPFLIRREDGYSVASLPYCHILIPAPIEDKFDWQKTLLRIKEDLRGRDFSEYLKKGVYRIWGLGHPHNKDDSQDSTIDYFDILTKAAADPCPFVRRHAAEELEKLRQEQYK